MRLSLPILLLPAAALAQIGNPNAALRVRDYITPTKTIYVDRSNPLASDLGPCVAGFPPCKTIPGACAQLTGKNIVGGVLVSVDAGVYPEGGCYLEGYQFQPGAAGAWLVIQGKMVPADGGAGLATSGTISGATQVSGNTFPSFTASTGGGWADGGLRGFLGCITSGTGAGQCGMIGDNTSTTVYVGLNWETLPASGAGYAVLDWGTIVDGGITMPPAFPNQNSLESGFTAVSSSAIPSAAAFIINGVSGANAAPGGTIPSNTNAPLIISQIRFTGIDGGAAVVADSDNVEFMWDRFDNLTPQVSYGYIGAIRDHQVYLLGNYFNGSTAFGADYSGLAMGHFGVNNIVQSAGNVWDGVTMISGYSSPGVGTLGDKNLTTIRSYLDWFRNLHEAAVFVDDCSACQLLADRVEVVTGDSCLRFGTSINNGSVPHNGTPGSGRIQGGIFTGCTNYGIELEGGNWDVRANGAGLVTGNAGTWGFWVGKLTTLELNAANGSTLTGANGDINLGGYGTVLYTDLALLPTPRISGLELHNSVANGFAQ